MADENKGKIAFELMQGTHVDENKKVHKVTSGRKTIVHSKQELDKLFNQPGSVRFKRLEGNTVLPGLVPDDSSERSATELEALSMADLRQLAADEEVDITGLKTKKEIASAIVVQ